MTPLFDAAVPRQSGHVVFHADDLGLSTAVTDGIFRGFSQGLLTSTSVLANAPDAARALANWKQLQAEHAAGELPSAAVRRTLDDPPRRFDLGVHLNLTQGRPLTGAAYPLELLDSAGRFVGPGRLLWRLYHLRRSALANVKEELRRQMRFLFDHGLQPTHVNGHQYVEMMPRIAELIPSLMAEFHIGVTRLAREPRLWNSTIGHDRSLRRYALGLVKRAFAGRFGQRLKRSAIASPQAYFGTVHAGCMNSQLIGVLLRPPLCAKTVEIALHPAEPARPIPHEAADAGWNDPLAAQRPSELALLLSAELPQYLATHGYRLGRLAEVGTI